MSKRSKAVRAITRATFLTGLLMMFFTAVIATGVSAAKPTKLPPEYLAGFAFFKYANARPNFEEWIKASLRYANATPRERVNMLRLEAPLLESRFDNYIPDENLIQLKVKARIDVPGKKKAEHLLQKQGKIPVTIELPQQSHEFFPLKVGNMWLALIPSNVEETTNIFFNAEEYKSFKKHISGTSLSGNAEGIVYISLLANGADTKTPMQAGGYDLWMLSAQIVGIELWDIEERHMAWYVEAPGHEARLNKNMVFDLYEN